MKAARTLTVSRLLIKRKHFTQILLISLAFPAAALAADGEETSGGPRLGQAEVATFQRPVHGFHRVVRTIASDIRAEERALARKREREREEEFAQLPGSVSMATLEAIASCESGGDPTIVSSDGTYRGKYQFSVSTWESVGGSGDPAAAPEAEQDYRAALLYAQAGSSPWPVCG
ncbi:MAG TPA: transglycosylase family protein [Solirubrobacterales bacterium]